MKPRGLLEGGKQRTNRKRRPGPKRGIKLMLHGKAVPASEAMEVIERRSARGAVSMARLADACAGLDPREFDRRFDLLELLREDLHLFIGGEASLSISGFPDALATAVDKIRRRTFGPGKARPSRSAVIAACISHATQVLDEHEDVKMLIALRDEFDDSDNADGEAEEVVAGFFRTFPQDVAIPGSQRRRNLRVPTGIKKELTGLADNLGASYSCLAVVLVMLTLCTQHEVNEEQRGRMAEVVVSFLRRVKVRGAGTGALMRELL